ncbi:MAG: hypothetical protein JSU96_15380 [Acidobacteriota bacterium]|nr:MAG: hypothetical protein JSU96_15380 [Acidobacteriota bacterium]
MLATAFLQALLLLTAPAIAEKEEELQLVRLQLRLEEAKKGGVYLTLSEAALTVSIANLDVSSLPVLSLQRLGADSPVASQILEVRPASSFTPVVKQVDKLTVDTTGAVESVDEIQSVEDMPSTFLIRLTNESYIWVQNSEGDGVFDSFRAFLLQITALSGYWWGDETSLASRALRIEMDPESARQLFWLARPGTTIIL